MGCNFFAEVNHGSHFSGLIKFPDFSSIFTARKRSLRQGNIFTGVCQEFCSQGGAYSWGEGVPGPRGMPDPRAMPGPRGVPGHKGVPGPGGCLVTRGCLENPPAWLLLWAVCILLECILVFHFSSIF